MSHVLSARIDPELARKVDQRAAERGLTRSEAIVEAVEAFCGIVPETSDERRERYKSEIARVMQERGLRQVL